MKYPILIRLLHFLLLLIVFSQIIVGFGFYSIFASINPKTLITLHKSLGLLSIIVVILFILRRLFYKKPPFPSDMPKIQQFIARVVHTLLYLTVLIMGLSGLFASMLFNSHWDVFYLFPMPQLIAPNPQLGATIFAWHTSGAIILSILIILHLLGVIQHQYIKKDKILKKIF